MKYSPVCRTIQINGKQHYLWRAVDQDGEVVDVYLQAKRDGAAAKHFCKRLLRTHGREPRKIATHHLTYKYRENYRKRANSLKTDLASEISGSEYIGRAAINASAL